MAFEKSSVPLTILSTAFRWIFIRTVDDPQILQASVPLYLRVPSLACLPVLTFLMGDLSRWHTWRCHAMLTTSASHFLLGLFCKKIRKSNKWIRYQRPTGARVAQWVRSPDLKTRTSLSPIRRCKLQKRVHSTRSR